MYKTWGFTTYAEIRIGNKFIILIDNTRNIREVMEIICNFIQIVELYKTWESLLMRIRICNEFVIMIDNSRNIREGTEIISKAHDSVVQHCADKRL